MPPARRPSKVVVGLDPRLELAGAVQLLAGGDSDPERFVRPPIAYAERLAARLGRFQDHPAVRRHRERPMPELDFIRRTAILLKLSPPPRLEENLLIEDDLVRRAGGRESLEGWLASLRLFARDARFSSVLRGESEALEPALRDFRVRFRRARLLEAVEAYAGWRYEGRYRVALSPFCPGGGGVNNVERLADGSFLISTVVGAELRGGRPAFWSDDVPAAVWHELGHGLFDVLADLYRERIERRREGTERAGYGTWRQYVKENVVRAVMIRLIARSAGEEAGRRRLGHEGIERYPRLGAMTERLREYEASRRRLPTLADFYPRLLEVFPLSGGPEPAADRPPDWFERQALPFPTPGRMRRAAGLLDRVLRRAPDRELLLQRGALRYLLRDYRRALRDAAAALALEPADPEALLLRGASELALGRTEKAEEDLEGARARGSAGVLESVEAQLALLRSRVRSPGKA